MTYSKCNSSFLSHQFLRTCHLILHDVTTRIVILLTNMWFSSYFPILRGSSDLNVLQAKFLLRQIIGFMQGGLFQSSSRYRIVRNFHKICYNLPELRATCGGGVPLFYYFGLYKAFILKCTKQKMKKLTFVYIDSYSVGTYYNIIPMHYIG